MFILKETLFRFFGKPQMFVLGKNSAPNILDFQIVDFSISHD